MIEKVRLEALNCYFFAMALKPKVGAWPPGLLRTGRSDGWVGATAKGRLAEASWVVL